MASPGLYKNREFHSYNLYRNRGYQSHVQPICHTMQTKALLHVAYMPAPMEEDDRPCEAVLAGD